jgi:hypothetical protein
MSRQEVRKNCIMRSFISQWFKMAYSINVDSISKKLKADTCGEVVTEYNVVCGTSHVG